MNFILFLCTMTHLFVQSMSQSYTVTSYWALPNCTGPVVGTRIQQVNPGSCFTTTCNNATSTITTCVAAPNTPSLAVPEGWISSASYLNTQTCADANVFTVYMVRNASICIASPSSGSFRLFCNATHGLFTNYGSNDCSPSVTTVTTSVLGCRVVDGTDSANFVCNATAPTTTTTAAATTAAVPLTTTTPARATTRPASASDLISGTVAVVVLLWLLI
jgi:hypothetical protein